MKSLRNTLFCLILAIATLGGMPVRVDEVEDLLHCMNQPKIAHTLREENYPDLIPAPPPAPFR